jgi:hypothetical protein
MDANSVAGTFNATGNGAETASRSVAWTLALDAYALDGAYQSAQKLWRNGRCVMVTAPGYNAETPIEVASQQKSQHDEEVDVSSETKFAVNLKHRFAGGALSQPVTAALTNGAKTLEPGRLGSVPAALTYKAPDEEDKQATAELKSTSKRGIGTLVLSFHTLGSKLTLEIKGNLTLPVAPLRYVGTFTLGPATFEKRDATTSTSEAPVNVVLHVEGLPFACAITFTGRGTTGLVATMEQRGNDAVWVVRGDPLVGSETLSGSSCLGPTPSTSFPPGGGGYGVKVLQAVREIVIARAGGTVPVHGSLSQGNTVLTVDGSATATIIRR